MVWVISDKEDVDTLEVVWMSIKKRCPDAVVNTLMTDDGKQVFIVLKHNVIAKCHLLFLSLHCTYTDLVGANTCSRVYPNVCHLLCRWHVDR